MWPWNLGISNFFFPRISDSMASSLPSRNSSPLNQLAGIGELPNGGLVREVRSQGGILGVEYESRT